MIFFLYGDDTFRSHEKLKEIKERYFQKIDPDGMNYSVIEGETFDLQDFNQKIGTVSFFSDKRMLAIKNLLAAVKSKETVEGVLKLLKNKQLIEGVVLLFLEEAGEEKLKEKKVSLPLFAYLKKNKFVQEFKLLNPAQLAKWAEDRIKKENKNIDKDALILLLSLVGNDLWQMNNEIAKLTSFVSGTDIAVADVHALVKGKIDDNIFNLVDAVSQKNKNLALKLIFDQLNSGTSPIYLLTMIVRQFRILIRVKSLLEETKSSRQVMKKLPFHPFVINKAISQLKYYSFRDLEIIYGELFQLDLNLKTGAEEPPVLFNLFINRII